MKRINLFVLTGLLTLVMSGCFSGWQDEELGTITINLGGGGSARSAEDFRNGKWANEVLAQYDINALVYKVSLTNGPDADHESDYIAADSGTLSFSVVPGRWTITLEAFMPSDDDYELVAIGIVTVTINSGSNPPVTIPMWPELHKVTFVIDSEFINDDPITIDFPHGESLLIMQRYYPEAYEILSDYLTSDWYVGDVKYEGINGYSGNIITEDTMIIIRPNIWPVTSNADSETVQGSLRYAINNAPSGAIIMVDDSVSTITLNSSLSITGESKTLYIEGNGVTITKSSSAGAFSLLGMSDSNEYEIHINRVHFKDGSAGSGGAISVSGTYQVNLNSCIFSGNVSTNTGGNGGGAIYAGAGAELDITGCTFYNNTAASGGAIYIGTGSSANLNGNLFYGNAQTGGMVYKAGINPISGNYNVAEVNLTQTQITNGSNNKSFESLGINGVPFEIATFKPMDKLTLNDMDVLHHEDFYGNARTNKVPGAVDSTVSNYITVTFNPMNETGVSYAYVFAGGTITAPTPARDGYNFDGWYREATFATQWTDTDTVTANIILYAKWVAHHWYDDYTGSGPYEISTAAELAELATLVNSGTDFAGKTINLSADIDLSGAWTPIGTSANPFKGTFDGNGNTISNLIITNFTADYQGLFGYIDGGTVQNVHLAGVNITGNNYVGGIAGYNFEVAVNNCSVSGNITGNNNVGGVVGNNEANGTLFTVLNCYKTGSVSGANNVGGVVGINNSWKDLCSAVQNCYNTGTVSFSGTATVDVSVGGVVGNNAGIMQNCYNTGTVSFEDSATNVYVGGLAGRNMGTVQNCYNTGTVSFSGTATNVYIGGLVGQTEGYPMQNCYNTGNVTNTGTVDNSYVGGIAGLNKHIIVQNCYNAGNVTNTGTVIDSYTGGVVGRNDNGTVQNCVALNASIIAPSGGSSAVGRVVGYAVVPGGGNTGLSNNYGKNTMTWHENSGGDPIDFDSSLFGDDNFCGADISSTNWNNQSWWNGSTSPSAWSSGGEWKFGNNDDNPWKWDASPAPSAITGSLPRLWFE